MDSADSVAKSDPSQGEKSDTCKELNPFKVEAEESKKSSKRLTGTVKWFNVKEGFGFITRHDTGEDVFVHKSCIMKPNRSHRVKSIGDGEVVEFGLIASKVTGPGFKPVKGSPFVASQRDGKGRPKSGGSVRSKREESKKKEDTIGDGLSMPKLTEATLKEKEKTEIGDCANDETGNEAVSTESESTASTVESAE